LPNFFVSCKNTSNEPNFIDFEGGDAELKNYRNKISKVDKYLV